MTKKTIPAVSIIIPMYNTEKYIGECLDSILAQTFTDFEVIVVDDCSTDNSAAIVESYIPKFDNRLRLIKSKKNSGVCSVPRNVGVRLARGEYLMFVDSDDAITKTAIEQLYALVKEFNSDVVACEKWFQSSADGDMSDKHSLKITSAPTIRFINHPTLISNDMTQRITKLKNFQFIWNVWSKIIRRNFLLENDLEMINAIHEDVAYTICLVCSAKNYVIVPNVVNYYRLISNSLSHRQQNIPKYIHKHITTLIASFDYVDKFLSKQQFFQQNPELKYQALDVLMREFTNNLLPIYLQIPAYVIENFIRAEFEHSNAPFALTAYLCNRMNVFNANVLLQQQQIQKLQEQLQQAQKGRLT